MMKSNLLVSLFILIAWASSFQRTCAQEQAAQKAIPSAQEVSRLLANEPPSLDSWPAWRQRLLDWMGDDSRQTEAAFSAATDFVRSQMDAAGELPAPLARDAFAWYLLGRALLHSQDADGAAAAERAIRRSIALDNRFARAHRNLALAILSQADPKQPGDADQLRAKVLRRPIPADAVQAGRAQEAERELALAKQLDPTLKLAGIPAQAALQRRDMQQAELLFANAYAQEPEVDNA